MTRAAVEIAQHEGLERVSMRRLGEELGVEAMSLYRHVANKEDLLRGMLDVVAAEMLQEAGPAEVDPTTWRAVVTRHCLVMHQVLLRRGWATMLWISNASPGPVRLDQIDQMLALLRRSGLPPQLLDLAFHALQNHVVGHAMQAVSMRHPGQEDSAMVADFSHRLDAERWPDLAAHLHYHLETPPGDDAFTFVLDLVLDRIEQLRRDDPADPADPAR